MPVDEACQRLLDTVSPVQECEQVALEAALGRVLAADLHSGIDVPPADNSAMDGYALRFADLDGGAVELPVSQRIAAGDAPAPLQAASAARIFTGAELPAGADCVVMQEQCEEAGGRVRLLRAPAPGDNIRRRGQDIARGDVVVAAGSRLDAVRLGLLASVGISELGVFRRPRVALFATGDELREPGEPLATGQIYNSNRYLLRALLQQMGCEVVDLGRVADTPSATRAALSEAARDCDCVLSSGGVSVGEEDHVRAALAAVGTIDFWKIAMKPGKPLACGAIGGTPFFGLPGNPVSTLVTFLVVVRPALCRLQGRVDCQQRAWPVRAGFVRERAGARDEYLRVTLAAGADGLRAIPLANQSSGVLSSCDRADALLRLPAGLAVADGDWLDALPLAMLMQG